MMQLINNITPENEASLSNSLRSMYSSVILYEEYNDESDFLKGVIELVEADIKYSQTLVINSSLSYRISNVHELATAFIKKYQRVIDRTGKFAYSIKEKYGYTIDLASVIGPYILYQFDITDENLSFYLALGMTISNIVCDALAKHEEKNIERVQHDEEEAICKSIYQLLERARKQNKQDYQINKSMQEIKRILDNNTENNDF